MGGYKKLSGCISKNEKVYTVLCILTCCKYNTHVSVEVAQWSVISAIVLLN